MSNLHPFWTGFYQELEKAGMVFDPSAIAAHPALSAAVAGGGLLAGAGVVHGLRSMQGGKPLFGRAPAAPRASGPSGKGLALAGLGVAGLGAYAMHQHDKKKEAAESTPVIADNDMVAHTAKLLRGQANKLPQISRHAIQIRGNRGAGAYINPAG